MTEVQGADWRLITEQRYQNSLDGLQEYLKSAYSYDISNLKVKFTVLEESKIWRFTAYKFNISITRSNTCLISLDLESLEEKNEAFVDFLRTVDGALWPIGTVFKLNKLELALGQGTAEISAIVHAMTALLQNQADLVVCLVSEMASQQSVVQKAWNDNYGFNSSKEVEYDELRYYRYDSMTSFHF